MSDQPYKPPIGTHYPTQWEKAYVKLHQENAALREQVERLLGLFSDYEDPCTSVEQAEDRYRYLTRRAQAAEAALEQHKYDKLNHFNAVETLNEEIRDRDCTIAALREGLEWSKAIFDAGDVTPSHDLDEVVNKVNYLLSSPNPGARVAAVLEAVGKFAQATNSKESREAELELLRAYRALDKREESDQ